MEGNNRVNYPRTIIIGNVEVVVFSYEEEVIFYRQCCSAFLFFLLGVNLVWLDIGNLLISFENLALRFLVTQLATIVTSNSGARFRLPSRFVMTSTSTFSTSLTSHTISTMLASDWMVMPRSFRLASSFNRLYATVSMMSFSSGVEFLRVTKQIVPTLWQGAEE